jgi:hypothetical protein
VYKSTTVIIAEEKHDANKHNNTLSSGNYTERKMKNIHAKCLAPPLGYGCAELCPGVRFCKVPQRAVHI